MKKTNDFGLNKKTLNLIKSFFKNYQNPVAIFGSRVRGDYNRNSDIDLVVYGNFNEKNLYSIKELFENSNIIYKIDIVLYENIKDENFKKEIDNNFILIKN